MKILVSWLREFVDVTAPAPELASRLSACGFEVASVEQAAGGDAVIDFEITANRPDCLSVVGLAREASTAYDLPLRLHATPEAAVPAPGPSTVSGGGLAVTIEAPDFCPRYAAAVAEVRVGPSPSWLAARLEAAGVRPINNVVDVTNYVLLEMGHPMHAFDLERLSGAELRARRAHAGERLRTLDGVDRPLDGEMLVIADGTVPQAVAGVMGGAPSEVWAGTRVVAFESAYFKPSSVRRTSKRLGLKTEASSRFERGTDIAAPVVALERALALLEQVGAGRRRGGVLDCYPAPRGPVSVGLRRARIAGLVGLAVEDEVVERLFGRLGFRTAPTPEGWNVSVPTFRVDISREADLVEEVARHVGYDRIPATFPPLREMPARPAPGITRKALLRHVLTAAGFSEAISFTFIEAPAAEPFLVAEAGAPAELVPLAYPLSEKFAMLRPSLLPGLLDGVAHNRRRESPDVRLFEIGSCFDSSRGEQRRLACACTGSAAGEHWNGGSRPLDFFDVKGVLERIGDALRLPLDLRARNPALPGARPYRARVVQRPRPRCTGPVAARVGRGAPGAGRRRRVRGGAGPGRAGSDGSFRRRAGRGVAAVPVDRPRYLGGRRRGVAFRARSRDDPGGRTGGARARARVRPIPGQGYSRRPLQPVSPPHVPFAGADADRRGGPGGHGRNHRRAGARARRNTEISHLLIFRVVDLLI